MVACSSVSKHSKSLDLAERCPVCAALLLARITSIRGEQSIGDAATRLRWIADRQFQQFDFVDLSATELHAQLFADVLLMQSASVDWHCVHSSGALHCFTVRQAGAQRAAPLQSKMARCTRRYTGRADAPPLHFLHRFKLGRS